MPLPSKFQDKRLDLTFTRPRRDGPGGDSTESDAVGSTTGVVRERSSTVIGTDGNRIALAGRVYFDDFALASLLREEDEVAYTSALGQTISRRIHSIRPLRHGGSRTELDHIKLEIA